MLGTMLVDIGIDDVGTAVLELDRGLEVVDGILEFNAVLEGRG